MLDRNKLKDYQFEVAPNY